MDADQSGRDLSRANYGGANLKAANLTDAYLTGAKLYQTNLEGTNLYGVIGADFTGAWNVPSKLQKGRARVLGVIKP